jgi:flagellum-specific peptidoglycan hydrolase FlgJ
MSIETDNFINKYGPCIQDAVKCTNIFPSVAMAQMILESSWGKGITAIKANNFFGIKADIHWEGKKMAFSTPRDGQPVNYFRVYDSVEDSIKDHDDFLIQNSRYKNIFTATTPEEQVTDIANDHYAEGLNYAATLINIIKDFNLKKLDVISN